MNLIVGIEEKQVCNFLIEKPHTSILYEVAYLSPGALVPIYTGLNTPPPPPPPFQNSPSPRSLKIHSSCDSTPM